MHILIGLITAVAGLAWALHSLQNSGVDLNSFNPFYWARRRRWAKQYGTKPLHTIEQSMEAAAVLMVATAQLEGELTREQKKLLLQLFSETFKLNEEEAIALFSASCHLLKDVMDIHAEVDAILAPSLATFSDAQKQSLQEMMATIANAEGPATKAQTTLIARVASTLTPKETKRWE